MTKTQLIFLFQKIFTMENENRCCETMDGIPLGFTKQKKVILSAAVVLLQELNTNSGYIFHEKKKWQICGCEPFMIQSFQWFTPC